MSAIVGSDTVLLDVIVCVRVVDLKPICEKKFQLDSEHSTSLTTIDSLLRGMQ